MIFKLFKSRKEKKMLSEFNIEQTGSVKYVSFHVSQTSEYMGYNIPDRKHLTYSASVSMNERPKKIIKNFNGWSIEDTTQGSKKYRIEADSMELLVQRVDEFINKITIQLGVEKEQLKIN